MNHPPQRSRKRSAKRPPALPLRRGDLLKIGGTIVTAMVLNFGAHYFHYSRAQHQAIEESISQWKRAYELTETQSIRIRELELRFHGTNFLVRPRHTEGEKLQHLKAIAAEMGADAGRAFLREQPLNEHAQLAVGTHP